MLTSRQSYFIVGTILLLVIFTVISVVKYRKISENGIYVVGIVENVTRNKSGSSVHAKYWYKDKTYDASFMPGYDFRLSVGRKFFIKILPDHPSQYDYLDIDVPPCALKGNWKEGWKQRPVCN